MGYSSAIEESVSHRIDMIPLPEFPNASVTQPLISTIDAVSVDVFDTILMRKPMSEVRRHTLIAERIKAKLEKAGWGKNLTAELIRWTRRKVQDLAFRTNELHGYVGDVRLSEIVARQIALLSLPKSAQSIFMQAEVAVEKQCLSPNTELLDWLRQVKASGRKLIAISDTTLPLKELTELIESIAGDVGFDAIYSSAESQATKRAGDLFSHVIKDQNLTAGNVWHFGDNQHADVKMAGAAGLNATHLPRSRHFVWRRKADGAAHMLLRGLTKRQSTAPNPMQKGMTKVEAQTIFGEQVLGPIVLESALLIWLYFDEIEKPESSAALFCARGGLLMHMAYETVIKQLGLDVTIQPKDVMISRLVASRLAFEKDHTYVAKEIAREFRDSALHEALNTIAGEDLNLGAVWNVPVDETALLRFLESAEAGPFKAALAKQNLLFRKHIRDLVGNASDRIVLVDTGLFGSTLKLMQDGDPARKWETLMLARSNYKGFASDHFAQAVGLWTQHDKYRSNHRRSAVLRYWQLIEIMFEPKLQSVVSFREQDGRVVSNLEVEGWQDGLEDNASPLFKGVMQFLRTVSAETLPLHLSRVEPSWKRFKKTIVFPDAFAAVALSTGERSRDFGRDQMVNDSGKVPNFSTRAKFRKVRTALWKSGAMVQYFPVSYRLLQSGQELIYMGRNLVAKLKRS